jgi:hypothetical protein
MLRTGLRLTLAATMALLLWHRAEAADSDPLRLVPETADVFVQIEKPRQAVDLFLSLATMKELRGFTQYREYYDSTDFRRFQQLVAYYEKQLGRPWPELLDQLAGGGAIVALKLEEKKQPFMLVLQGRSPELTRKFADLTLEIVEQELARQESKDKIKRATHNGVEVVSVGDGLFGAVLDSALVVSNVDKGVAAAIELHKETKKVKSLAGQARVQEARKLAPQDALAWGWLNVETVKKAPQFQELQKFPGPFSPLYIFIGGWLDVAKRSPFAVASLHKEGNQHVVSLRLPRGQAEMPEVLQKIHAPAPGTVGALPPLQPKGVVFSHSFYLDLHEFWQQREKMLTSEQLKVLDDANKKASPFLLATRFGDVINAMGARHRLVATTQFATGYKTEPLVRIPSLAFVGELNDPETFVQKVEAPLRSFGLLAGLGVKMNLVEEKHGQHTIIGYRFAENQQNKDVANGLLFNFSPCFVRVGNKFILSTTLELAHTLIDLLEKEQKQTIGVDNAPLRAQFSWQGVGAFLGTFREQLVTQILLQDSSSPEEAGKQVQMLLDLLGTLGRIDSELHYEKDRFQWDFRVVPK